LSGLEIGLRLVLEAVGTPGQLSLFDKATDRSDSD